MCRWHEHQPHENKDYNDVCKKLTRISKREEHRIDLNGEPVAFDCTSHSHSHPVQMASKMASKLPVAAAPFGAANGRQDRENLAGVNLPVDPERVLQPQLQHLPAYVSIRQNTPAYVSIRS